MVVARSYQILLPTNDFWPFSHWNSHWSPKNLRTAEGVVVEQKQKLFWNQGTKWNILKPCRSWNSNFHQNKNHPNITRFWWWCFGDDCLLFYDDVLMMFWLYNDTLMIIWWHFDDAMMTFQWSYEQLVLDDLRRPFHKSFGFNVSDFHDDKNLSGQWALILIFR